MRFYSLLFILVCFSSIAEQDNNDWLAKSLDKQKEMTAQFQQQGVLQGFQAEQQQSKLSLYIKEAKQIAASSSNSPLAQQSAVNSIRPLGSSSINVVDIETNVPRQLKAATLSAVFVSFSMNDNAIREAFIAADEQGAEVYFMGMHPADASITDTMKRIASIMKNVDAKPHTRFHPKAFEELAIQSVPVILHARRGQVGFVKGLLNFGWLEQQMQDRVGVIDLGTQGPTRPVEEENIVHVLQRRLAGIDMAQKKEEAVNRFWQKHAFIDLPDNVEPSVHYINPTVKVSKDIVNPNGEILARAGQQMNPIVSAPSKNRYYLFDAMQESHVNWALSHIDTSMTSGIHMFMASQLDRKEGWTHLSSLRHRFSREIYLIPQEMLDRFKISGLPAIVSTDAQKGLLRIEHVVVGEEGQ